VKKIILHLCADLGSDSYPYQLDQKYKVILVGEKEDVRNFSYKGEVQGIIANPVCTELSTAKGFHKECDIDKGMILVDACIRIIQECKPKWWVLENPANGRLKEMLGKPNHTYQPWQYGSPWTKKTGLWGNFNMPEPTVKKFEDVEHNHNLYCRPGRRIASLAFCHKSHIEFINEFKPFAGKIENDADFRSLCSQGFANEFKKVNP